jgi:hypothetical protein
MSGHLQADEVKDALLERTIAAVEIDDDGGGHFDEIRITLDNGDRLELGSWGAYGYDSYVNVHRP